MGASAGGILVITLSAVILTAGHGQDDKANKSWEWQPECGSSNPNNFVIDQSEPDKPGPFHDLTTHELKRLREFLENCPFIMAVKPGNATVNSSYIYAAELFLPRKAEVLRHLDDNGPQPIRQARAVVLRGDKSPPLVEEYVCGPLPDVSKCELLNLTSARNPVEFSVRPLNMLEVKALEKAVMTEVEKKAGFILKESYGESYSNCGEEKTCLTGTGSPVGSGLHGDINTRYMWINAMYNLRYPTLHFLDFAILVNLSGSDQLQWSIDKVWYSNRLYKSLDELVLLYNNNSIPKTKVTKPTNDDKLYSSLWRRWEPHPSKPQRPPKLVEPDGKRYSVKNRKVEYMGWSFNYRISSLTGPAVYDINYQGERIAFEIALADIAVFYSGFAPFTQTADYLDTGLLIGTRSRALIPGADCPDTATLLSMAFMSQHIEQPTVYKNALCLFENNNGDPLRQHLAYDIKSGGFYGGMLDSALTLRAAMAIGNYDYLVDFVFHQNGVIETRFMSTGYIQATFFASSEKPYGHHIENTITGNIHHHMAHFKVDLDIDGTSNRYETLDLVKEKKQMSAFPDRPYSQMAIRNTLKRTEQEAIYDYDFSLPKYHLVHNDAKRNQYNETRSYRIEMKGMSKNLLQEGLGNELSITWARHQMVVTKHRDDEITSGSLYGFFDSQNPVVNFSRFYEDDENIVDEDLVFWIASGHHHIPHAEDIPVTANLGNDLTFFLIPHNYFPECPSISSRDAIFIEHNDSDDPTSGVKVERNGNSRDKCVVPGPTLEEDVEEDPDRVLESRRPNAIDF